MKLPTADCTFHLQHAGRHPLEGIRGGDSSTAWRFSLRPSAAECWRSTTSRTTSPTARLRTAFYTELTGTVQILSKMVFNKKTPLAEYRRWKTAFTLDRNGGPTLGRRKRTLGAYSGFRRHFKEVLENSTGKPDKDGMATLVAAVARGHQGEYSRRTGIQRTWTGSRTPSDGFTPPKVARRHRGGDSKDHAGSIPKRIS